MTTVPPAQVRAAAKGSCPLESGDRLTRAEFERRYAATPQIKRAELIEGEVHMPSPVHHISHGKPHAHLIGWLVAYCAATPGVDLGDNVSVRLDQINEVQPDALLRLERGQSRLTQDADIRVALERDDANRLLQALPAGYKPLATDPEKTLRRMGFVFLEDPHGCRVDILLADTPYDALVIRRAKPVEVQTRMSLIVCTAEDLIIYKMISTRGRDRDDVIGIVRRQGDVLDDDYILDWLRQFEQALDDSTLVMAYRRMRGLKKPRSKSAG